MQSTTLALLRHAHTEANERGSSPRMAGWCDIPLSAVGEAQLDALDPSIFAGAAPVVYTSTSPRALCTARAVADDRRIVALRTLREIGCGDVEGWLLADVAARLPEWWQRNLAQNDPDFAWPGGESYRHFRARVLRVLRAIARRHPGECVIVVTHAGVIAQTVGAIVGASPALWERYRPLNCSVTTVELREDGSMGLIELGRQISRAAPAAAARRHGG